MMCRRDNMFGFSVGQNARWLLRSSYVARKLGSAGLGPRTYVVAMD